MTTNKKSFAELLEAFRFRYDLSKVFNDLLTLSLCSLSYNPQTGKSPDEDLYLSTIKAYEDSELRFLLPKLFATLVMEMEGKVQAGECPDVLGAYYETNLAKKGAQQYFTPWSICQLMTEAINEPAEIDTRKISVLDPACGSGRMLIAGAQRFGQQHYYYGIDIDPVCVKMTAMNFFLNGLFHAEVMCADALLPGDFKFSYKTSLVPFGVFRITNKEHSVLWHKVQNTWSATAKELSSDNGVPENKGSQLKLF